ncbi:MAG: internalization competence protein, competence protein ComEC protein [candidate division WS6 bacterium GW2011_GWC1_33_20]|uniref:Internalization competence protein, competence protein ComEC protein n=1 Tax=candidate division WS6 bacterium GW2011_GWC1_33_20 TaxID=1619089 RepID=A0A0F9ZKL2_9BACT|nr:MAG: internalization competence protein, competence protein ComEC protein [candidate division WS6 bacterium GW2011_GWF1_33_233]KKP44753.1 MAG: internalization competence protein, competence protein ComEC protein [candidate division WS6 bacterium GW2011_GWC1_33_20]HBB64597.1 hypothetical protein [Patescibacteria group bacterium]
MTENIVKTLVWVIIGLVYLISVKYENSVVFLNVGQGDATLIQNGTTQILVDGGPDMSILYELPKYVPIYDRKIEYVILTHSHDDHLIGLLEVLKYYSVDTIFYYPGCNKNENYEYLLQKYHNLKEVSAGDTIRLGDIDMNIIWPVKGEDYGVCYKPFDGDINNDSIVVDFEYLGKKFLLMSDVETPAEEVILQGGLIGSNYDTLKGGHHCSNSSSSKIFLERVSPSLVICSVGEGNSFGHPGSETVQRFKSLNVQYLVTYEEGNIQIK